MSTATSTEPLKPEWPMNVLVFKPTDDVNEIKTKIEKTSDPFDAEKDCYVSDNHFSNKHYALLFAPGEYKDCKFEVGYYVGMAGLGKNATSVKFTGEQSGPFVPALNKDMPVTPGGSIPYPRAGLCLDTFWRSAENYSAVNTMWAVSQAAPLRRVHISNQLMFGDGGAYSSGGFVANAEVGGECNYVANQQWFSRGVDFKGSVNGGAWSTVFSGCTGNVPAPGLPKLGGACATVEETPDTRVEKPFIVMNGNGEYELHIPKATKEQTTGAMLDDSNTEIRPFSQVKVGKPILPVDAEGNYSEHDDATYNVLTPEDEKITLELQEALDEGKDLVLCPGLFFLTRPLIVKNPNQVILGLGLATLIAPQDGSPCIRVQAKTPGVRIAGMTLEASKQVDSPDSPFKNDDGVASLLDFGEPAVTDDAGDSNNPGLISDIFTRVGGSNLDRSIKTDAMVRVHSGNVVGDNLWLWRADHVKLAKGEDANDPNFPRYHQVRLWEDKEDGTKVPVDECVVKNALVVTGNDVKMYGLFCEHTTEHQMVWKGERGSVSFFQCELPYDVDIDYGHDGFTGYYVDKDVTQHSARGIGVYCNFQCYNVHAQMGLSLPSKEAIIIENPFTRFLNNKGGINTVVHQGGALVGPSVDDGSEKLARAWVGEKRAQVTLVDV